MLYARKMGPIIYFSLLQILYLVTRVLQIIKNEYSGPFYRHLMSSQSRLVIFYSDNHCSFPSRLVDFLITLPIWLTSLAYNLSPTTVRRITTSDRVVNGTIKEGPRQQRLSRSTRGHSMRWFVSSTLPLCTQSYHLYPKTTLSRVFLHSGWTSEADLDD